jgi:hypothetical protein
VFSEERMTKELCQVAESENPHNIYEPIELLYLLDWERHPETIVQAFRELLNWLEYWDSYAKENTFMSGGGFGMADCVFYPILAYRIHRALGLDGMGCFELQKYVERCGGLRAVSEARLGWERPGKTLLLSVKVLRKERVRSSEALGEFSEEAPMLTWQDNQSSKTSTNAPIEIPGELGTSLAKSRGPCLYC